MKLYEKYESVRDRFEVLAFHDDKAKTFEELDEKLAAVSEKRWEGRTLPFPILLDATGLTVDAFGIRGFPTNVLIDPEGRVVRGNAEETLRSVLRELAPPESEEEPETDAAIPGEEQEEGDGQKPDGG